VVSRPTPPPLYLAEVAILVANAAYLTGVLADEAYRFRYEPDVNRSSIERVFGAVERRPSAVPFSPV
jgi:hypothetical protein